MARKTENMPKVVTAPVPGQIAQAWATGKLPRCVVVVGQEAALREEALRGIRKAAFPDGDGGMSWVVLHGPRPGQATDEGPGLTPAVILDELFTRPMFAEPDSLKVVVVRQAEGLFASRRKEAEDDKKMSASAAHLFEDQLPRIPDAATLVIEVAEPGRMASTNFYKKVAAWGGVIECFNPEELRGKKRYDEAERLIPNELARRAKGLNLELNPRATAGLLERCGPTLGILEEELAKLAVALGATEGPLVKVGEDDIARLCAYTRLVGAFEFADALADRDLKKSWEALGAIFSHGLGDYKKPGRVVTNENEIAMRLLGALTWKLTQLQDLRAALDGGMREFDAMKEAKLFGFRAEQARRALRQHNAASLRKSVEALFRINLDLRTGQERKVLLERLALAICRA